MQRENDLRDEHFATEVDRIGRAIERHFQPRSRVLEAFRRLRAWRDDEARAPGAPGAPEAL